MKPTPEWDLSLARQLAEPPLPDAGFSRRLKTRLARRRRWRQWALSGAASLAISTAAVGLSWSKSPLIADLAATPTTILAVLGLAAACSLVWIGTEASRPTAVLWPSSKGPRPP